MHCKTLQRLIGKGFVLPPDKNGWCHLNFEGGHTAQELVGAAIILAELAGDGKVSMVVDTREGAGNLPSWADLDYESLTAERN